MCQRLQNAVEETGDGLESCDESVASGFDCEVAQTEWLCSHVRVHAVCVLWENREEGLGLWIMNRGMGATFFL